MPLLASIDVGSNSLRLLIGNVSRGIVSPIRHERIITRLAQGITGTGLLAKSNMEKTLQALTGFMEIIKAHGVKDIKAMGTSALREAENSGDFIERVLAMTGITINVIPGGKEAELTARGVLSSVNIKGTALIIDIGGGSTEWILCKDMAVIDRASLPTGVVRLLEKHIHNDPPSAHDISSLENDLQEAAGAIKDKVIGCMDGDITLIGTAGTATTLASIDLGLVHYNRQKVHMHEIALKRLIEIKEMLLRLPLRERAKIRGLEPERADLIIPGIHFTIKVMEKLGTLKIIISDSGLLEGIIIMLSEEVQD